MLLEKQAQTLCTTLNGCPPIFREFAYDNPYFGVDSLLKLYNRNVGLCTNCTSLLAVRKSLFHDELACEIVKS